MNCVILCADMFDDHDSKLLPCTHVFEAQRIERHSLNWSLRRIKADDLTYV
jgi:hypothetical protein